MRPQLSSAKSIHLQFSCVLPCSCLCSSIRRRGLAFLARSTGQRTVDNLRRRGAAIAGFGTCCSEAESICVAPPPNRTYPEPVGRSGPRSHQVVIRASGVPSGSSYPTLLVFGFILESKKKPYKKIVVIGCSLSQISFSLLHNLISESVVLSLCP